MKIGSNIDVEAASLTLKLSDTHLNDLTIEMDSPDGTKSILLSPSAASQSASGFTWSLESEAFRGELSAGTWTVKVSDPTAADTGTISNATLDLYGSTVSAGNVFHYTDEAARMDASSASRIILNDAKGVGDWIDTAATTGNETVDLHTGNSSFLAGAKFLTIGSSTTIDNLTLGAGTDTAIANNDGDKIVGGGGLDTFLGGSGNDTFVAGWGGGSMTGGTGSNTFAFGHDGFGATTITDFFAGQLAGQQDHIDLRGLGDSFAKLSITTVGSSVSIGGLDASNDHITLANAAGHTLTASNFLFA